MTSVLLAVSMEKLEMRLVYSYKASVFEITNMTRMTMQLVKDELGRMNKFLVLNKRKTLSLESNAFG